MGCVKSNVAIEKGKENVVCEICNICFNSKERIPMIICENDHNSCRVCVDDFSSKDSAKCPFCRRDIDFANLRINKELVATLQKY